MDILSLGTSSDNVSFLWIQLMKKFVPNGFCFPHKKFVYMCGDI